MALLLPDPTISPPLDEFKQVESVVLHQGPPRTGSARGQEVVTIRSRSNSPATGPGSLPSAPRTAPGPSCLRASSSEAQSPPSATSGPVPTPALAADLNYRGQLWMRYSDGTCFSPGGKQTAYPPGHPGLINAWLFDHRPYYPIHRLLCRYTDPPYTRAHYSAARVPRRSHPRECESQLRTTSARRGTEEFLLISLKPSNQG
ncbi:hypothetical protein PG994_015182 [Apiospora phragmitis]|uniref:Uncharacterized protein n=1 Tax=Apiospora phragmitis TaxID=2905665 RepID=A0ABR1SVR3_9PEZI